MASTIATMASTITRAQIAPAKRATLYGYTCVEPSLLMDKNRKEEKRMASTIRKAQANTIARAQVAAAVKPTLNDRISVEPNTLTEKNLTEELSRFAAEFIVFCNHS